jgi:spermidine synthase
MRIREERFLKEGTVFTVAISGFSLMVFQMVVLLSFQIICGYLYYKLGIIITAFMIGLALGSFTAAKAMPRLKKDVPVFILNTAGIFLYAAALPFILLWINGMKTTALSVTSDIIFPAIPVVAGFLGGFQFPLAGKIYMDEKAGPGRAGGFLYGADLSGACLGALLSGAVFIPLAGIVNTCIFTAGLNFMMAVLLLCGYTIRKRRL